MADSSTMVDRSPEADWSRLSAQARHLLRRFGKEPGVAYVISNLREGSAISAAIGELLLLGLLAPVRIEGEQEPGYTATGVGLAVLTLGEPEDVADAAKMKWVRDFLNRQAKG